MKSNLRVKRERVNRDGGFSLVEMMFAATLLSVTALGIASAIDTSMKAVRNVTLDNQFQQTVSLITLALNNPASCKTNLTDPGNLGQLTFSANPQTNDSINVSWIKTNQTGSSPIAQAGQLAAQGLRIDSMRLSNFAKLDTNNYSADLIIQASKLKNMNGSSPFLGSAILASRVSVGLYVSNPVSGTVTIQDCSNTLLVSTCTGLGGTYTPGGNPPCTLQVAPTPSPSPSCTPESEITAVSAVGVATGVTTNVSCNSNQIIKAYSAECWVGPSPNSLGFSGNAYISVLSNNRILPSCYVPTSNWWQIKTKFSCCSP